MPHNNGMYGLVGLAGIFGLIFAYGRYCRSLSGWFYKQLADKGFGQAAEFTSGLKEKFPYLVARSGPKGVLFLLGSKLGGSVPLASGGSVRTVDLFQGFIVPAQWALPGGGDRAQRKELGSPFVVETLQDGSQIFLWARAHNPRQLAKTFAALNRVIGKAALG